MNGMPVSFSVSRLHEKTSARLISRTSNSRASEQLLQAHGQFVGQRPDGDGTVGDILHFVLAELGVKGGSGRNWTEVGGSDFSFAA